MDLARFGLAAEAATYIAFNLDGFFTVQFDVLLDLGRAAVAFLDTGREAVEADAEGYRVMQEISLFIPGDDWEAVLEAAKMIAPIHAQLRALNP